MIVSNGDVNDGVGSDWSMMRRDMSDKLGESSCLVSQKGLAGTDDCDKAHWWDSDSRGMRWLEIS